MPSVSAGPSPAAKHALPGGVDVDALRRELEAVIEGEVRFDQLSRALYSTDASVYRIEPLGVVIVKSRADIVRTVQICRRHGCPLTMRGGGTSQAGQAIGDGIQVDTSKYFNRLLEVNVEEQWVRVEPGIVLNELNDALAPSGLRFAPDISTANRATVGGMMANNSSGARSVLYGKTIDHVLEQIVVLSDGSDAWLRPLGPQELDQVSAGDTLEAACYRVVRETARSCATEIDRRYPKILRRVGGYNLDAFVGFGTPFNLTKMIVGSEGTLGVVVEAKLSLVPLPRAKAVMAIQFDDLLDALAATPTVLEHRPSAVEVMDRFILDHTRDSPSLDRLRRTFIDGEPGALLSVELYADRAEQLGPRLDALERSLVSRGFGTRYHRATDTAGQARIWHVRESALGLSMAMKDEAKSISFVEDTAVAPERLRDYIERFLEIIARHGTTAGVYAHASVGCLHVRPVVNMKTADGVRMFEAIANDVADLVLEFGGALSGEHGDGLVRGPFMEKMFGTTLYEAFRTIKRTFDPANILNPGKIVDTPPLTSNLRFGPDYRTTEPDTFFDYSEFRGLAGAVEMCSGLGACRKTLDGTMCPSYMATREETHSTRGRANVLRLAMSGRLGDAAPAEAAVREALGLCLECRACRSECPVGVDMARFKSEFLAGYHAKHGAPFPARVLGHVQDLAPWGSRLAPVSNWLASTSTARSFNERFVGIDRRRTLPRWAGHTFRAQFEKRRRGRAGGSDVLLFNDTFTNHYEPEIGMAGVEVLEAAGLAPDLAPNGCCGRPLISQGLLDEARARAETNTDTLYPFIERGSRLVFFEPSCLSAVREDAPSLLRGAAQDRARRIAESAFLFEDLLEQRLENGSATLALAPGPGRIVLHTHCHQKAMALAGPSRALLARIPGASITELDAGCCGMAGSFGYTRDHFDVSVRIAERRLLPAARGLEAGAMLAATGTSCRHQVADLSGVRAWHPAEILRPLLERRA